MDSQKDGKGRDEMNLAEMPIALLSARAPKGMTEIVYQGTHGKLTISGSSKYGLPTADASDVILGLIQLTREKNGFTSPDVSFTRYELLRILARPDTTKDYRRIDESLNRWMGVLLVYDDAWWDARTKQRVHAKFHILESVVIARKTRKGEHPADSRFSWNREFFRSIEAENLKRIDLGIYFGFRSAISKQMYRHLDKRFYAADRVEYRLRDFACGHVGLSPNYSDFDLKRKLNVALDELRSIGFIAGAEYRKIPGEGWWVHISRGNTGRR